MKQDPVAKASPSIRVMQASAAAYALHSKVNGTEHTAPARAAALARFEREVDPDGTLPVAERRKRADAAKRAHMTRMAVKSAQARAARRSK